MASQLPALLVVVPLLTAVLIAMIGPYARKASWLAAVLAMAFSCFAAIHLLVLTASGVVVVYSMGGWLAPTGIEYRVDRLNALVLTMVATVGVLGVFWMRLGVAREIVRRAHSAYYAVVLLFLTGLLGITITGDLFNLYVFLEITSIASYVLVSMGRRRQALYAGFTYLVLGSIGATFLLLGIGHLYMATGTLQMADLAVRVPEAAEAYGSVLETAFAFIAVGLAVKMALFPLHGWQPGAYTHAPSGASLLLAATATKVAAYAFYRIAFGVFGAAYLAHVVPSVLDGLIVMAAAAMIVGPLLAVRQDNLKRMLAYSSMGQIGYVLLGALLLNRTAMEGSLFHFWTHAASKGALFGVAGALVYATGASRIDDLRGMGRTARWTSISMTLAALSLAGVPLTGGFVTKYYLGVGAVEAGWIVLLPLIVISSVLTAIYMWRCLQRVWFAPADVVPAVEREVPWSMRLPTFALALACVGLGVFAWIPMDIIQAIARAMIGGA